MTEATGGSARKLQRLKPGARVVAERYARALLAVALDKNADSERIASELESFQHLFEREPRLVAVMSSSRVQLPKRLAVVDELIEAADSKKIAPETANLLRLLVKNERIALLGVVAEAYRRLVLEAKKIQPGEVTSARPLSSEQQERLAGTLGAALDKTMELSYRTDPELVGGLVVRIENRVFDASVTTELRRFKERALSGL